MSLRDLIGATFGLGQKTPESVNAGQQPAPMPHPQMVAPTHMVPGTGQSAGYMQPGQGHALVGQMPQQPEAHRYAALLHALGQAANGMADGSNAANEIMQQGNGNNNAGVAMAAQPHLYYGLANAYRRE